MTYEETIRLLSCEAIDLVGWGATEQDEKKAQLIFDKVDAIDISIECIKKQIPKKPIKATNNNGEFIKFECPMCGGFLLKNYPCKCGQMIAWDEKPCNSCYDDECRGCLYND